MTMAEIYAQLGYYEKSVDQIEIAISQGWMPDLLRGWWMLEDNHNFKAMGEHSVFLRAVDKFNKQLINIRNRAVD